MKALLETNPARVQKLLVAEGLKPDKRLDAIFDLARRHKIHIQTAPRSRLDTHLKDVGVEDGAHQGVLALVSPKPLLDLNGFLRRIQPKIETRQWPLVLVLDEITDPRNFGAILRVADGAGIDAVLISKHHSASFGPAVAKTASGAEENVDVVTVSNINQALEALKKAGFWIAGAAGDEKSALYWQQDYKMPVALVMGSEGSGMRPLVRKHCDFLVRIPMSGIVDSLNVAVATGILAYEIKRQQGK